MFRELKYFFFISVIFLFIFLTLKYYFSDLNKKNSYRSLNSINSKIIAYSQNLILLSNNTSGVVEYAEQTINKNKKNYNFWNLINNND
jgi:heme/copper-type cytochrome/quinol oxidase subunit 3